jgi:hypothetical protein
VQPPNPTENQEIDVPFYQCFKTRARVVYCSSTTYRSHPEAVPWVAACMAAHGIPGNQLLGKPFPSEVKLEEKENEVIVWP